MSLEENKEIVRRYMEELNKGNLDIIDELIAPGYNEFHPDDERSGPERERHTIDFFFTRFPPWRTTIQDLIAEGDQVVVKWAASGTHKREWQGVAPTGKSITVKVISIYRLSEDKIVGRHSIWNQLDLLKQIGAFL